MCDLGERLYGTLTGSLFIFPQREEDMGEVKSNQRSDRGSNKKTAEVTAKAVEVAGKNSQGNNKRSKKYREITRIR